MKNMNKFESHSRFLTWSMALLLSALAAGCGGGGDGGRDPILGTGATLGGAGGIPGAPAGAVAPGAATCAAAVGNPLIPRVTSSDPANAGVNVATSTTGVAGGGKLITASFSLAMNAATINSATAPGTFTLVNNTTAGSSVAGAVTMNAAGTVATFTTAAALPAGNNFTATITQAATSAAGTPLACIYAWNFTTIIPPAAGPAPINLGSASTFGTFGGTAGMTNQGLLTIINGDIGTTAVSTAVTGFHDTGPGCTYTETPLNVGTVNGLIFTAPPPPTVACPTEGTGTAAPPTGTFGIATIAAGDALAAYNTLAGMAVTGPIAANLSGLTVPPGVYSSATGFLIQDGLVGPAGDLTLDGQGNANAVWVFKSASTLTVGGPGAAFPRSVRLINGAQAKNVFWQVGSTATINAGGGGTMEGTIIAQQGVVISTAASVILVTLNGRALSLVASVTMVNTIVNVPAP